MQLGNDGGTRSLQFCWDGASVTLVARLATAIYITAGPTSANLRVEEQWTVVDALMLRARRGARGVAPHTPLFLAVNRPLFKFCRMLFDNAVAQHVSHVQDLLMDAVVSCDVRLPIALDPRHSFSRREIKMLTHHLSHVGGGPVWIGAAQEVGNLIGICYPAFVCVVKFCFVVCFSGTHYLRRGGNVFLQKRRKLIAGGVTVIRLNRVADINLILQQALCGSGFVR